jgi:hypothetical protein
MDVTYAASLIRAWVARRHAKGEQPNADAIWNRIQAKWPEAGDFAERIFQASA